MDVEKLTSLLGPIRTGRFEHQEPEDEDGTLYPTGPMHHSVLPDINTVCLIHFKYRPRNLPKVQLAIYSALHNNWREYPEKDNPVTFPLHSIDWWAEIKDVTA